tara:strand:- start:620 stop:1420 length:801 start_codon:yes stop_codon:yes gene_type:complete
MKRVLVIGDNCTDVFVYGKVNRLCPDVPAPVFTPTRTITDSGMAGNVVRNFKSLGLTADCMFNETEMTKIRYVDEQTNHTFLRVDEGDTAEPFGSSPEVINFNFEPGEWDAIVISDYCKGFVTEELIQFCCENNPNVFIDTKKVLGDFCKKAKIIKINEPEYNDLKGKIKEEDWEEKLIVTLGKNGCRWKGAVYLADQVEVFDLCGAGDSFLAALVFHYLETGCIMESIFFANDMASQVVQKRGVVACFSRTNEEGVEDLVKKINA